MIFGVYDQNMVLGAEGASSYGVRHVIPCHGIGKATVETVQFTHKQSNSQYQHDVSAPSSSKTNKSTWMATFPILYADPKFKPYLLVNLLKDP